jgi:hypothetical protein
MTTETVQDTVTEGMSVVAKTENVTVTTNQDGNQLLAHSAIDNIDEKRSIGGTTAETSNDSDLASTPTKRAKIDMPPVPVPPISAASMLLLDVEKYELDAPLAAAPSWDQVGTDHHHLNDNEEDDMDNKIQSPCLIIFGLHPYIRESPLKKMLCQDYGTVIHFTIRSALANRYCHVEFETIDQAKKCYKALNGAKLFQKTILVQPGRAETRKLEERNIKKDEETNVGKSKVTDTTG